MCTNCATKGSVCAEPQREEVRPSLNEAGEELVRALESALIEQALSRAKTREDDLERRIAALEEKLQEVARSPETADSSPSKEGEEYILVAPIRGIGKDGHLILGDQRILSAKALKI